MREKYFREREQKTALALPIILFLITALTTTTSGALYEGVNPFVEPSSLVQGLPFSASLLLILGTHELGHYFASRFHGVTTTLPVFIPGPPILPMIGTFGAVIRIKSPITTRRALVDIGASGPLAGFVVAIIVTIIGLRLSWTIPLPPSGEALGLGSSLLFHALSYITFGPLAEGMDIYVHPVAFAGWLGFFVTSINLLPIGQLDGGHIIFSVLGRHHRKISIAVICVLLVLGILKWPGWVVWALLVSIIGIRHPPTGDAFEPLDARRRFVSLAALVVFILTFTPTPFYIN